MEVFESESVIKYLTKRSITKQYRKAKQHIMAGNAKSVLLKPRQPKNSGIYQFRITRKYRAFAVKENNSLFVFEISDHQN
ncbi:MAG: hypothetical protein GKR88_09390 [Flavobacteriaceae bacterium]|nr:MAG: hypothetical protein GKR88_09390 [Flavobacteriaceae bacterium]